MAEPVDIVVSETGTDAATQKITALGQAADAAATQVDSTNASLGFLKDASATVAPPLQQIAAAAANANTSSETLNNTISAQSSLLQAQQQAADRAGITLQEFQARTEAFRNGTSSLNDAVQENTENTKKNGEASEHAAKATGEFSEAGHLLREALALIGIALTTDKILEYADAYEKIEDQLSSVSRSMHELHGFEEQLYEISQRTGSSFEQNVGSFQKLSASAGALGVTQKDLLTTIEGVDSAVRLSGGSSKEAAQALNIFERALATGQVEGRQFRTLLQQFPQLGALVAKGLNEPVSALSSFSTKAPVAAKDFIEAFNRTSETALQAGSTIRLSLGSALQVLQNSLLQYVGQLNSTSGATNALANVVLFLANNITTIATVVRVAATAWLSYYAILVGFPAVIGLITGAFRALTVAIAANPLGFLIVALTTVISLVYQFGDSIKLTSDGSISLLGALIGTWNVLRNVLGAVWSFMSTALGPAFRVLGTIISVVFNTGVQIVRGFLNILSFVVPQLKPISDALGTLVSPLVAFKDTMVSSMTEATTALNESGESTKTLAQLLGGDDPVANLSGAATKASTATKTLSGDLTQMGRVNTSLIPIFTGAFDAHEAAIKKAQKAMEDYDKLVKEEQANIEKFALVSRNAFGEMVKASDEWALRSGANFNSVADAAGKASAAIDAAQSASTSRSSASSGGGGGGGGGGGSEESGSFQSSFNIDIGAQQTALKAMGVNLSKINWSVISAAQQSQLRAGTNDRTANAQVTAAWTMLNNLGNSAAAHLLQLDNSLAVGFLSLGLPTFAQGGAFNVGGNGGVDSQLVQFWASPDERVTVETPAQVAAKSEMQQHGKTIVVNMKVITPDADSFRRSQTQNLLTLKGKLAQVN